MSSPIAMPPRIKNFFLYRHVWNNVNEKDTNATFVIVGKPGRGKSTLGLKICQDLDPTFNTNRVCYGVKELLKLIKDGDPITGKLKPGQAAMFDELVNEQGGYSRTALSRHNQIINYIIANFRAKRIVLVLCLPKFSQLDKDIREVGLTGTFQMKKIDFNRKKSKAVFKWREVNEMTDTIYDLLPRLFLEDQKKKKVKAIWFSKPTAELEQAYKLKKMAYIEEKAEAWLEMLEGKKGSKLLSAREIAQEILKNPERFRTNGLFDHNKVLAEFEVGDSKARSIVRTAGVLWDNDQDEKRKHVYGRITGTGV